MKKVVFYFLAIVLLVPATLAAQKQTGRFFNEVDAFLKKTVHFGRVDYAGIKKKPQALQQLVQKIAAFDLQVLPEANARKAFYINAYNLLVVYSVVQSYPIKSPMDVKGFFDATQHTVAGQRLTLNDIEHKILRPQYKDPRLHFGLVCAAIGCPSLIPGAYFPDRLDAQLDARTKATLNSDKHVRADWGARTVYVSELFKWYKDDFLLQEKSVIAYLNRYRTGKIPEDFAVDYIRYDWSLNEYRQASPQGRAGSMENLQSYTPTRLLRPGEMELKWFNNLYTQTAVFNEAGDRVQQNNRASYFTAIFYFLAGVTPGLNVGADIYVKSVRVDEKSSSPFAIFKFSDEPGSRTALSSIAPKIKIAPFAALPTLAIQTLVFIPVAPDMEGKNNGKPFLEFDNVQWWTQIFYDYFFTETAYLYFEGGFFFRFDNEDPAFLTPAKLILNYFPSNRWTTYLQGEIAPTWEGFSWSNYYTQFGAGLKFQATPHVELEALYTRFPFGKSSGAGVTYNLGFRFIK